MGKQYNIFISHSWTYGDAYDKLIKMLKSSEGFEFKDYSVPKNDPIHNADNDKQLKEAIIAQMRNASVVVIMAGVYATYSKWIKKEIEIAKNEFGTPKKIIAIEPWGSEKTSSIVKEAADKIVSWNTNSIVNAIKELG